MFEITFRTEDKATWHKLLEVLGSLDMPHLVKEVANTNGKAQKPDHAAIPLQEIEKESNILKGIKMGTPVSVFKNWTGDIEIPEGFIELLENYNPLGGDTKHKTPIPSSSPIDSVPSDISKEKKIVQWGGMEVDISNIQPGFGCAKGMFEMSPDFDEPLEDFNEYMY